MKAKYSINSSCILPFTLSLFLKTNENSTILNVDNIQNINRLIAKRKDAWVAKMSYGILEVIQHTSSKHKKFCPANQPKNCRSAKAFL